MSLYDAEKQYYDAEKQYYDANKQSDYEPLLKDPNTPTNIITDIVDRLTILSFKLMALKHPNISARSQRYIIQKSDKKVYQKEIIQAFLSNEKILDEKSWHKICQSYNVAGRFDKIVLELLHENDDVFTVNKLDVIFNTVQRRPKVINAYVSAIINHKNFDVDILDGSFIRDHYNKLLKSKTTDLFKIFSTSKNKENIFGKLYLITSDITWLSDEAKDIFLF